MPKTRPFTHAGGGGPVSTDMLSSYYLEMRAPIGLDQGVTPAVLVRVAGDLRGRTRGGLHTWLLDMTPATTSFRDAGLVVGQTFTDPAGGVSFTVLSLDATQASVQIDIAGGSGAPTCLDGTSVSAPGPERCDEPPLAIGGMGEGAGGASVVPTDFDAGRPGGGRPGVIPTTPTTGTTTACGCALDGGRSGGGGAGGGTLLAPLALLAAAAAVIASRRRRG
jgi:hypothetical protein